MEKPLYSVLEDAIWQALDSEQGMPHSGVVTENRPVILRLPT